MNKRQILIIAFVMAIKQVASQHRINYQASVRNQTGNLLLNRTIGIKFDITDSSGNNIYYSETQSSVTDKFGIINLSIGGGKILSGNFSSIPWNTGRKFLKSSFDTSGGVNYSLIGSSEMLAVPFALFAVNSGESLTSHQKGIRNLIFFDSSGSSIVTGRDNISIGHQTLQKLSSGNSNIAIGPQSGMNVTGNRNISIGAGAIENGGDVNELVAIGYKSLSVVSGQENTSVGAYSMMNNTSGKQNVAFGTYSLTNNITGQQNTAIGYSAMGNAASVDHSVMIGANAGRNIKGNYNVGVGSGSLANSIGIFNTAVGNATLEANLTGTRNTAMGQHTMSRNTIGENNTSVGFGSLVENVGGSNNSAFGTYAMDANVSGYDNAAFAKHALQENTTGSGNTSLGTESMYLSVTGSENTGVGYKNMYANTSGSNNTSIGAGALKTNTTGSGNIALGYLADVTASDLSNATVIGYNAQVSTPNTMVLGNPNTVRWGFGRSTTTHALQVGTNATNGNGAYLTTGGAWTNASSREFKENFSGIDGNKLLNDIKKLDVLRWKYKGTDETHIGPVAEQFSELFGLGVLGDDKHVSTVDVSGIALRAIQALCEKIEEMENRIKILESKIEQK